MNIAMIKKALSDFANQVKNEKNKKERNIDERRKLSKSKKIEVAV